MKIMNALVRIQTASPDPTPVSTAAAAVAFKRVAKVAIVVFTVAILSTCNQLLDPNGRKNFNFFVRTKLHCSLYANKYIYFLYSVFSVS